MLLLLTTLAAASDWSVGLQLGAARDLPADPSLDGAAFETGPALSVPVRWSPRPGASLRLGFDGHLGTGADRVVWTETDDEGFSDTWYSDAHWTLLTTLRATAGPEFQLLPAKRFTPYLGVGGGGAVVTHFHDFTGDPDVLLGSARAGGLQPYTVQVVPAASAQVGLRFGRPARLAVELEGSYGASFVPAAGLYGAPSTLGATRSAYALDVARVGLGLSFPL